MLLMTPGYALTTDGKLYPAVGGCVLVSGGRLTSDGRIHWDAPTFQANERKPT